MFKRSYILQYNSYRSYFIVIQRAYITGVYELFNIREGTESVYKFTGYRDTRALHKTAMRVTYDKTSLRPTVFA